MNKTYTRLLGAGIALSVAAMLAGLDAGGPAAADGSSVTSLAIEIKPSAKLVSNGAGITVTVKATCTPDKTVQISVKVTQNRISGDQNVIVTGEGQKLSYQCTNKITEITANAPQGSVGFDTGTASATATMQAMCDEPCNIVNDEEPNLTVTS